MKRCPKCGYKELPPISRVRAKLGTQPAAKPWRKDRDLEAMKRLKDPRSYIRLDGSEVLYGEDWRERVAELAARSGGRCERLVDVAGDWMDESNFQLCLNQADDPHHITRRSIRRDDRLSNLQHICRAHHIALDPRQVRSGRVIKSAKVA